MTQIRQNLTHELNTFFTGLGQIRVDSHNFNKRGYIRIDPYNMNLILLIGLIIMLINI